MSVAELKVAVITRITSIDNESVLNQVLSLLQDPEEINKGTLNLSQHYIEIKNQYGDVLQKLDQ